jgi:hypothetical protein
MTANKPLHPILGSGAPRLPRPGERRRLTSINELTNRDGAIALRFPRILERRHRLASVALRPQQHC